MCRHPAPEADPINFAGGKPNEHVGKLPLRRGEGIAVDAEEPAAHAAAVRLLPSTNGWFSTIPNASLAAFSTIEG